MYELSVEGQFSAAHRLVEYPGNCARWHGHNWQVTVFVQATELDGLGMAVDFRQLKAILASVLQKYDHLDLNEVDSLSGANPTCERIAQSLYRDLAAELYRENVRLVRVRVSETPSTAVTYSE